AGWVVTGNRLSDLPRFVSLSFDVAAGYTDAMMVSTPGWRLVAAVLLLAVALVILWVATSTWTPGRRLAVFAVAALVVYTQMKHAFVRADKFHTRHVFEAAIALVLAIRSSGRMRAAAMLTCVLATVMLWR